MKRILIISGGISKERLISLDTGLQVAKELRKEIKTIVSRNKNTVEENDKDYVFLNFILNYLPTGLIGLLIAVIICAAMSSTASELNALAATTTIDIYKRSHKNYKYLYDALCQSIPPYF